MFQTEIRILVLDDMPSMRQMVKGIMRGLGYKNVLDAENGKMGFQMACEAAENNIPFKLILSDWNMPVLSGIQFLELMRKHPAYKDVPFLLITAEGEFRQVKRAMELKVSDYVVKPFTPALLKAKLESAYKKHFPNGEGATPAPQTAATAPGKPPARLTAPAPAPATAAAKKPAAPTPAKPAATASAAAIAAVAAAKAAAAKSASAVAAKAPAMATTSAGAKPAAAKPAAAAAPRPPATPAKPGAKKP